LPRDSLTAGSPGQALGLWAVIAISPGANVGFEELESVVVAQEFFARAFGVGHETEHVLFQVVDAGDVAGGAVGVRRIAAHSVGVGHVPKCDLSFGLQRREVVCSSAW
jgi:hypothetical protein